MHRIVVATALAAVLSVASAAAVAASPAPDYTGSYTYTRMQRESTARDRARTPLLPDANRVVYTIPPTDTDPTIAHYLRDNYVMFEKGVVTPNSRLFLFLVGTNGVPDDTLTILGVAANQGYRVISLAYDSMPATSQVCTRDPDPTCSGRMRQKRAYGDNVTSDIPDAPNEAVVPRLKSLLKYLIAQHPGEGWNTYLTPTGDIDWSRVAIAGHSQGAGLAAYIAKKQSVARVIMFSDWDYYYAPGSHEHLLAPWITAPSATPADRWYGMYHQQEPTVADIQTEFAALGIPESHIRVATLPPTKPGAYHTSIVGDGSTPNGPDGAPAYVSDWLFLLGSGAAP